MKNFRKKLATALTAALVISTMAVSASAVNVTRITSCSGNDVLSNLGSLCTDPEALEGVKGVDIQRLLGNMILNGGTTSDAANENCAADAENTSTSSPEVNSPQSDTSAVKQSTNCDTTGTRNAPASTAVKDAAVEDTSTSDTTNSSCTGGSCPSGTDCSTTGSDCRTDAACITGSCVNGTGTCGTIADVGTSCTANASLLDRLNSIFSKLGIDFQNACISLLGDDDTSVTETPQPTQDAGTPRPTQDVVTPQPTQDVGTPQPTQGAGTPQPTQDVGTPQPTQGAGTPQPTQDVETPQPTQDDSNSTPNDNANIDNLSYEQQVVALVNEQRAANGLAPLTLNASLSNVARAKSQDMHDNNYFSHTSPTYGSPFDMMQAFGISYKTAGENIAMGYGTPEAVVTGWMNSPGHRANILNANYTQIGVGYVADGNYWTQEFIG